MEPLSNAAVFLVTFISQFYIALVLLRFLMQWARADFYNPLAQVMVRLTNPLIRPLRRFIPSLLGLDIASLLLAFALQLITLAAVLILTGKLGSAGLAILPWALLELIELVLHIYLIGAILLFVVSWVAPYNNSPLVLLTYELLTPLTERIQKFIPPIAGVDFSLMVIVLGISLMRIIVTVPLMKNILGG